MKKMRIKIVRLGQIPKFIDFKVIKKHKSSIFEIIDGVDDFQVPNANNGVDFSTYSCDDLYSIIPTPNEYNADIVVAITYCSIPNSFYGDHRGNRAIFSLRNIIKYFEYANIPIENVILKMAYEYSLGFDRGRNCFMHELLHDETRGCLFDMDGILEDVIYSFNAPQICTDCKSELQKKGVPINVIQQANKEIGRLRRPLYYHIAGWIKTHPILSIFFTLMTTLIINVFSNFLFVWIKTLCDTWK